MTIRHTCYGLVIVNSEGQVWKLQPLMTKASSGQSRDFTDEIYRETNIFFVHYIIELHYM